MSTDLGGEPLILSLTSSAQAASAALIRGAEMLAHEQLQAEQGLADHMAPMVARLLGTSMPGLVAVMVGPGSFTGLRAAIALALGVGLAAGCEVVGVSASEAFAETKGMWDDRLLWTAIDSRRGRVFLDQGEGFAAFALDDLPRTRARIAVVGDAANLVAATLAARGTDVMLTGARLPSAYQVALAGAKRARGDLPPRPAVPLYVDPPEARLPAGGLRPEPA